MKIVSVSSSRADLAALTPVWRELALQADVDLHVVLTGMHRGAGGDRQAAHEQLPQRATCHEVGASLGGSDAKRAAMAMADILVAAAQVIDQVQPDVVLVMGDRLDMIPAALAAVPFNVPIAHLHGGELTFGAVDDRLRHAMSKLAHVHFTSGVDAAKRLARMGETPAHIHVTGAPGLDALSGVPEMPRPAFLAELGLAEGLVRLVTVHSETNAADPLAPAVAVLAALDRVPGPTIITAANADMGGAEINRRVAEFAVTRPWVVVRDTLGQRLYANALRHAAVMVGNSSSGLVEAGLFGLHVINVGSRQDGRARGLNVRDVPSDPARIAAALSAVTGDRYDPADVSIYGDARSAPRIAEALRTLPERAALLAKGFNEAEPAFAAPWGKVHQMRGAAPAAAEDSGTLVTRSTIVAGLDELGVSRGDTIIVHTALSALGFVAGGARTVIEALIEAVGERGTVVMPTFTGDLTDPSEWRYPPVPADWIERIRAEMPPFDRRLSPTRRMGSVAELFRHWPGVIRSAHPQSSFAAMGPAAGEIVGEHPLDFRFGPGSPLARLEERDAVVVMLGAPWSTISAFYRTQADAGSREVHRRRSPVATDGRASWVEWEDHTYTQHWFGEAAKMLIEQGLARRGRIGGADTLVFRLQGALASVRTWRRERNIA